MSSFGRQQLEDWLKTIDVKGTVIDAGGSGMKLDAGRVRSWEVTSYKILDKNPSADIVANLNRPVLISGSLPQVDNIFCLETMQFLINPFNALVTMRNLLKPTGNLYISFHFIYPAIPKGDALRYTQSGVEQLLSETGFEIKSLVPMKAADPEKLNAFWTSQTKSHLHPEDIGFLVHAIKV